MSKPRRNNKKHKTGIPGLSITAKEGSKPPPDWILDFPKENVSSKIELHQRAIGEHSDENGSLKNPEDTVKNLSTENDKNPIKNNEMDIENEK